nr:hypothetical protein [Kofleriaceae bacterium]
MKPVAAVVVSVVIVAAALSPVVRDPHDDGFPLSTYPMFATPRDTHLSISFAYGRASDGERVTLDSGVVGTGEVLQALTTIGRAGARGRGDTEALCKRIAGEVSQAARFHGVAEVVIATGDEDAIAYLRDGTRGPERVRARCKVLGP